MSIADYIKILNRLQNQSVARFGNLSQFEQQVFEQGFDWLVSNLDIKRGNVVPDERLTIVMNQFGDAVGQIIANNSGYQGRIRSFLSDLGAMAKAMKTFQATAHGFDIERAGVTQVQKTVVNEAMNQFLGNGLNANFVEPLRDAVYRNTLVGASIKDVKQVLRSYVISGRDQSGKLWMYIHNTSIQAVDTYAGAINQKLVEEFNFTGYIISGSLIETSSKQCLLAVDEAKPHGGYLPFKEWEVILEVARNNPKAKLIAGTTIKTLPLNKLHWGCRHDFTPTIM